MAAHIEFHKGGGDFDCAILEGLMDAFAFILPEFAIGEIGAGEAMALLCEENSAKRGLESKLIEAS